LSDWIAEIKRGDSAAAAALGDPSRHEEIARQARRSVRTVERRLQRICRKGEEEPQP
jgi:hypothetical protein